MDFDLIFKATTKKHKSKPAQFESVAVGVLKRRETRSQYRKNVRLTGFDSVRDISHEQAHLSKSKQRLKQLRIWQEERDRKKKLEAATKKKPFVAGKYQPPPSYTALPPPPKPSTSSTIIVTRSIAAAEAERATTAQSFAPRGAKFQPKLTLPRHALEPTKREINKKTLTFNPITVQSKRSNKTNVKPPQAQSSRVTRSNQQLLSTKEQSCKTQSCKTPEQIVKDLQNSSPYPITVSRGKSNAREEAKMKIKDGLHEEDASDMENVVHFRRQLDSEVSRISALCDTWDEMKQELPEFAQELVLGAVGQARLLMKSKLQQFAGLVDRCEAHDTAAGLVTPADLQGFWDMVFLQIENIEVRFKKLEDLREREWREEGVEKPPAARGKCSRPPAARAPRTATTRPSCARAATSRLRETIAAARKKQQSALSPNSDEENSKTFEAGFFCVKSPVRRPASRTPPRSPRTPAAAASLNRSLLKGVLSSEARKASAVKASPSIDLDASPARSILKPIKNIEKSCDESVKTVLFNESEDEMATSDTHDEGTEKIAAVSVLQKKATRRTRKKKLTRQSATELSPLQTRKQRTSVLPPETILHRNEQNPKIPHSTNVLQEIEVNAIEDNIDSSTPGRRSYRNKTSAKKLNIQEADVQKETPRTRRSSRLSKMMTADLILFETPEPVVTPKSTRRRGRNPNADK